MNEQNTGPDFGENSGNISKISQNSEAQTIGRLESIGVNRETAIKLAGLREDMNTKETNDLKQDFIELSQDEQQEKLLQVNNILAEHRKHISDRAEFERSELRRTLNVGNSIADKNTITASIQSLKTIGTFGKDLGLGFIEAIKNPAAAMQYTMQQADGKLSQTDIAYKIEKQNTIIT